MRSSAKTLVASAHALGLHVRQVSREADAGDADTVNDRAPPALTQIAVVVADTSAHARRAPGGSRSANAFRPGVSPAISHEDREAVARRTGLPCYGSRCVLKPDGENLCA